MFNQLKKASEAASSLTNYNDLLTKTKESLNINNANTSKWQNIFTKINLLNSGTLAYKEPFITITGAKNDKKILQQYFTKLTPWRKGPYMIDDMVIDSEWRCDMKWQRLIPHIAKLDYKLVLDVGCSNGFFSYNMALSGAKLTIGLEPFLLFNYQFYSIYSLVVNKPNLVVLPLRVEQINNETLFDTIFSMGVLYHQKSPIEHLLKLNNLLNSDGELVLETLVVDGGNGYTLMPKKRYASMRNVWFLPSIDTLVSYLMRCGFCNIRVVDITPTTNKEQRVTKWLGENAKSLSDFLSSDFNSTIEGYPAPKRAICICNKKSKK